MKTIRKEEYDPGRRSQLECRIQAMYKTKVTVKNEDVTIMSIYATNNIKTTFMNQKMEGETDGNTLTGH